MNNTSKAKKSTPKELINEGLGNKEKFKSKTFRKIEGEIKNEEVESIKKAEKDDIKQTNA